MNSIETVTEFLGWCTLLNFGLLMVASLFLTVMRGWIVQTHMRMFGLSEEYLLRAYFQYLAQYKIAIFVLNLVPYVALKLIPSG